MIITEDELDDIRSAYDEDDDDEYDEYGDQMMMNTG